MLYLNQLEYSHIKYYHNAAHGGPIEGRDNVGTSGCGLCSLCMIVDHLTTDSLDLEECVRLSEESGANHSFGTDMKILGPIIAERFGLDMDTTTHKSVLIAHLQNGGEAIAHVGNKGEGVPGLFTARGHYVTLISAKNEEICILDPSFKDDKFDTDDRRDKVRIVSPFVYCTVDTLLGEIKGNGFYLFKRKADGR